MRLTINIEDRLGEDIKSFCKANNVTMTDYLSKIIEKQFSIDRFGDMNEMIKPKHGTAMNPIVTKDNKNVASKPVDGVLIGGEKNEAQPVEVERVAHEVETPKRTKRQLKVK